MRPRAEAPRSNLRRFQQLRLDAVLVDRLADAKIAAIDERLEQRDGLVDDGLSFLAVRAVGAVEENVYTMLHVSFL